MIDFDKEKKDLITEAIAKIGIKQILQANQFCSYECIDYSIVIFKKTFYYNLQLNTKEANKSGYCSLSFYIRKDEFFL